MHIYKRVLIILITIISILFILNSSVFANPVTEFQESISTGGTGAQEIKDKGGEIVGVIQVVGTAVSVGMLIVIGIKYVLGSADEKASYKKSMLPYLIGAVLIFGFSNITQVIYEWAKSI